MQMGVVPLGVAINLQALAHQKVCLKVQAADQNPLQVDLNLEDSQTPLLRAVLQTILVQVAIAITTDQEIPLSQYHFFHITVIAQEGTLVQETSLVA